MKRFFSSSPIYQSEGLSVIRIITGFFLTYHGSEVFDVSIMNEYVQREVFKNTFSPSFMVYMGKTAELVAGFLLLLGWLTRLATVAMIITFSYIAFFVGQGKIWYEDQYPFLFVLLAFVFFFAGPGKWSVDDLLFNKTNHGK